MIDLLADLDIFGVSPEGLGVSFEHTSHLSNSNYLLEKSELHQNEFKLSVVLGYVSHDPYNAYHKLVKFLDKAPYKLEYETPAGTWQREVRLKELTKTEIVSGDVMMEDFTLSCFTPWYRNVESKYDPATDIQGDGKIYKWFDSRIRRKMLYAFAYSADGTEGFTTDYPNENLLEEIIPYSSDYFHFGSNDSGAWNKLEDNIMSITTYQVNKYAQFILFSDPATWGGLPGKKPTTGLQNLTIGAEYTISLRFRYSGLFDSNTRFGVELGSRGKDGTTINKAMDKYVYVKDIGVNNYYNLVVTGTIPEGFYDDIKSVILTFSLLSGTSKGAGSVAVDRIKLEAGNKATGSVTTVNGENVIKDFNPYDAAKIERQYPSGAADKGSMTVTPDTIVLTSTNASQYQQINFASRLFPSLKTLKPGKRYRISFLLENRKKVETSETSRVLEVRLRKQKIDNTDVTFKSRIVWLDGIIPGIEYYITFMTDVIPEDFLEDVSNIRLTFSMYSSTTIAISGITIYEVDDDDGNNGLPTYIGQRVVQADYKENINLVTRSNIFPIDNVNGTIDFNSWYGEGLFTFNKTGGSNAGIYLMSKKVLKRNVEYNLHLELRDSINGLRNFFIYNPFQGDYTSSIIVDGEPSDKGFGKTGSDIYWLGDPDRPEHVDKQWHTIDITFNLSDKATIEGYEGFISQPDKWLNRKINVEHKHVMLTEGPYPGYYTQEEIPDYYVWSRLEGKWEPPTPDGKQHDLTYDNKIYDYVYSTPRINDIVDSYAGYDYDYIYEGYANGSNGVFNINNEAIYMGNQKGSPVEIFIDGPSKNPYWQVIKDGKIIMQDGFNIEIGEGSRLVVSSVPGEQRAELVSADGVVSNVYQQQRLDLDNFITIPPGYSTIAFFNAKKVSFNLREERVVV